MSSDFGLRNETESDDCCVPRPDLNFVLDTNSFVDMDSAQTPMDCNVYTDGSKLRDQVGSGVYIVRGGNQLASHCVRLPDAATVYQAEVIAIREAAIILQQYHDLSSIKFFVDSQAALKTFQAIFLKSKVALDMIQELNKIKHSAPLVFVWTKAHVGTEGNEEADRLAKEGTKLTEITIIPEPSCNLKDKIDREIRSIWQTE